MKNVKLFLMAIALTAIFTLELGGCRTVKNPVTGRKWMSKNLGALQIATSSNDDAAYGYLYQWGRATDGHQNRKSGTTTTKATTALPDAGNTWDGLFITGVNPYLVDLETDWLTPQDNTLWQGESGTNNPCPNGFRLPTGEEWEVEILSWVSNDAAGAFASPLKLTAAGVRNPINIDSVVYHTVTHGTYWASTFRDDTRSTTHLWIRPGVASLALTSRTVGASVRCIKD